MVCTDYFNLIIELEGLLGLESSNEIMPRFNVLRTRAEEYVKRGSLTFDQEIELIWARLSVLERIMRLCEKEMNMSANAF